jgi:hypothetical protein
LSNDDTAHARDSQTNDSLSRISALIDFYSDRAVAHASFLIASIFGLVSFLSLETTPDWASIFFFLGFSYVGYFTLIRFGYYADISQKLTELFLKDLWNKKITDQDTLGEYLRKSGQFQQSLLYPKKFIYHFRSKNSLILFLAYWLSILLLGVVNYHTINPPREIIVIITLLWFFLIPFPAIYHYIIDPRCAYCGSKKINVLDAYCRQCGKQLRKNG